MTAFTNIQQILKTLPLGQVATRRWLLTQGATVSMLDNALKSGKLQSLAHGVVARPGLPISWQGVLASFHRMWPKPVWLGGLSALEQHGLLHDVQFGTTLYLYSTARKPAWLEKLDLSVNWRWMRTARLWDETMLQSAGSLQSVALHKGAWWLASPEQAWLETLALLPDRVGFEQADHIAEGLVNLSPRRLRSLLSACSHVRAKRLFFFFADRHQPAWFRHLDASDYELGRGKRAVVAHGKLNRRWKITVPEAFHDG